MKVQNQEVSTNMLTGRTRLFSDFLDKNQKIRKYLKTDSPQKAALEMSAARVDREQLADILEKQNLDFQSRPRTFESIEKLTNLNTLCVFGGQQAGLMGGPILTIYKMIDIVKRAALLEDNLRRPVIPVFWMAGDDHDFEEINHTYTVSVQSSIEKILLQQSLKQSISVAEINVADDENYKAFKNQVEQFFAGTDFSDELISVILQSYSPGTDFVTAFARFMNGILPDMGLILLNPFDKDLKTLSRPFFKQIVERHFLIRETLEKTETELLDDDYHIQAEKKDSSVHLFYHNPERVPLHYIDDKFVMGDKKLGLPALLDLIERNPEKFSTGVLTRPIWQSYLFPTVVQIGGPSEIAYFCQVGGLFELFRLTPPYYSIRSGATIIEKHHEDALAKLNIKIEELTGDVEQVINRIAEETFPNDIKQLLEDYRSGQKTNYDKFAARISEYDSNLDPMLEQTFGKIDFAMNNLEKKLFTRHKKHIDDIRVQIYKLSNIIYPEKNLQERVLNISYYISKYGLGIIKYIGRTLDVTTDEHQIIYLSKNME